MFPVENHKNACTYANAKTREKYGQDSTPCEPGTEQHRYWLNMYDEAILSAQRADVIKQR